jgi:hypothetical protein
LKKEIYSTLDAYQAGFLQIKGHIPELIEQGSKFAFCFKASKDVYKDLNDYQNGASIEAVKFAMTIKQLKTQIHSLRRGKGNKYVQTEEGK